MLPLTFVNHLAISTLPHVQSANPPTRVADVGQYVRCADAAGEAVMGLATQLVSWGPATAQGAARLVELNLATEKLPAQSSLLGLDADDTSLLGAVLLLRAKAGLWTAHAALVAQAPTLVWLAAEAGATAVVFVDRKSVV